MNRSRWSGERGSVVAEFAVALPAIVLVLLVGVGALAASARHVRLQDAVADAARLSARGESAERAAAAVSSVVGDATVGFGVRGDLVCVTATAPVLLGLTVTAEGCALDGGR